MMQRRMPGTPLEAQRAFVEAVDAAEAIRQATPGLRYRHTLTAAPVGIVSMQRRLARLALCMGFPCARGAV